MAARPSPAVEVQHRLPRCLLRLRDRAAAHAGLDGEGIQRWLEWELEAPRFGLDPDVGREELAVLVEGSAVEVSREGHREGHAEDFARWGYGRPRHDEAPRHGVDVAAGEEAPGAGHGRGAGGGLRRFERG